jgi:two-component system, chemotaxis family, response regulator Rcp1
MPVEVLLVEDSPGDVRIMQEALREGDLSIHLQVASDGVEAIAYLKREGAYVHARRPDLILLDLNLPKIDGREVLAQIKQDAGLKAIPVVVLTTSDAEADVVKSYQLHANCFVRKPLSLDAFEGLVITIRSFWLEKGKSGRQKPSGSVKN